MTGCAALGPLTHIIPPFRVHMHAHRAALARVQAIKCCRDCCCSGDDSDKGKKEKKDKKAKTPPQPAYEPPKGQDPAVRANAV